MCHSLRTTRISSLVIRGPAGATLHGQRHRGHPHVPLRPQLAVLHGRWVLCYRSQLYAHGPRPWTSGLRCTALHLLRHVTALPQCECKEGARGAYKRRARCTVARDRIIIPASPLTRKEEEDHCFPSLYTPLPKESPRQAHCTVTSTSSAIQTSRSSGITSTRGP